MIQMHLLEPKLLNMYLIGERWIIKLRREAKEQAEELFYKIIKEQAEKQYEEDSDDLWFSFFGKDEEEIKMINRKEY